jgi:hypothetical protein
MRVEKPATIDDHWFRSAVKTVTLLQADGQNNRCVCGNERFFRPMPKSRPDLYECHACRLWYDAIPVPSSAQQGELFQ